MSRAIVRKPLANDGNLQQVDTPRVLFAKPANVFVAGFIGSPQMNLHEARVGEGGAFLAGYTVPLPRSTADAAARDGSTVTLGFRPEALEAVADGERLL